MTSIVMNASWLEVNTPGEGRDQMTFKLNTDSEDMITQVMLTHTNITEIHKLTGGQ